MTIHNYKSIMKNIVERADGLLFAMLRDKASSAQGDAALFLLSEESEHAIRGLVVYPSWFPIEFTVRIDALGTAGTLVIESERVDYVGSPEHRLYKFADAKAKNEVLDVGTVTFSKAIPLDALTLQNVGVTMEAWVRFLATEPGPKPEPAK